MVRGMVRREKWALPEYYYFDMYAGPGCYTDQIGGSLFLDHGSPMIAAGVLRGQPHKLFFNDSDPQCVTSLTLALAGENALAQVTCLDASEFSELVTREEWRRRQFDCLDCKAMGLLFADPNGAPDWNAINAITSCQQYERLDVLVNVNATSIKRCRTSPKHRHKYVSLREYLDGLRKRYLYVWTPHKSNCWQFALIFASNWKDFPEFGKSKFWRCDKPEGREVLDRLNYTQKELCA
jgi:three-Cys-motif partner protein